jgi:hypothetical protein
VALFLAAGTHGKLNIGLVFDLLELHPLLSGHGCPYLAHHGGRLFDFHFRYRCHSSQRSMAYI